ncbi:MAG: hypothetical protein P8Z30_15855 [Acidobacteriota bacterium]
MPRKPRISTPADRATLLACSIGVDWCVRIPHFGERLWLVPSVSECAGGRTVGRTGLWVTLLPGLGGLVGLFLLLRRARPGAWLLGAYSLFWIALLISGLPAVWNAHHSFCFRTLCITTPWVGRLLLLALAAAFVMAGLWACREATRDHHKRVEESA